MSGRSGRAADARAGGEQLLAACVAFGRELRAAGLSVGMADVLDFGRALDLIHLHERDEVRAASRTIFVRRHADLATHDEVFDSFWNRLRRRAGGAPSQLAPAHSGSRRHSPPAAQGRGADGHGLESAEGSRARAANGQRNSEETHSQRSYSATERLRRRAFDRMTAAELAEAEVLISQLVPRLKHVRTRRHDLHHAGSRVALRAMLRRNVARGGEFVELIWQQPRLEPRPVALLCDISGSMELYGRLMLRFAQALAKVNRRTEVFAFGTRLTRITPALREGDPREALQRVAARVVDWSGGTRIGEAFREFNRRWAGRGISTSGTIVVVSDGWDRGEPALVASETARLQRNCRQLIWLNPLAGSAGYQPLAAGMAAALPHVDVFLPATSLMDLQEFVDVLASGEAGARSLERRTEQVAVRFA